MKMAPCMLVTGGCGFIGNAFVCRVLANTSASVVNFDALTYAAQPQALAPLEGESRYQFVQGNINDAGLVAQLLEQNKPDALIKFAAESRVDRSITGPTDFARTNIQGTLALLETCRDWLLRRNDSQPESPPVC